MAGIKIVGAVHISITGQVGLPSVYVSRNQQDLTLSLTQIQGLDFFTIENLPEGYKL